MSGATSRRKGARFERAMVHRFREAMPGAEVRRGLQCRGEEVADVDCPVFWPELKRGKKPNIRAALRQAIEAAPKGRIPIAIIRDDRSEALVTLLLDDFLDLVSEWWARRQRPGIAAMPSIRSVDAREPRPMPGYCGPATSDPGSS